LVDALEKWVNQLRFTVYEYSEGHLLRRVSERIEPEYVEYIEQMKVHLRKVYSNLLPSPSEIEFEHKKICVQIEHATVSLMSTVPYKPSYEKIIVDKIKTSSPALSRSQDVTENDIYWDRYIFGIIFDTVQRQEAKLALSIKPTSKDNIKQLFYEGGTIITQGEESPMIELKRTVENLIIDESIMNRFKEYQELRDKLQNDPQIEKLRVIFREMHSRIYGGAILGGYPACDLCDPDIPVVLE
jgi:hypothetical protein